jgi:zinc D-Ala-D-Ala carboxypeptidase
MLEYQSTNRFQLVFILIGLLLTIGESSSEIPKGTDPLSIRAALAKTPISRTTISSIQAQIDKIPDSFRRHLLTVLDDRKADPMLLYRVDKTKALPDGYAPMDLSSLEGTDLSMTRGGLRLRKAASVALEAMNVAAKAEGIILLVSSSYRSYAYQIEVWNRGVTAEGEVETAASIARPGHSQHQLGTAIDFGSITDAFAQTPASLWLLKNAYRFGFSCSYPRGMSAITGYKWESWHYRYIGKAAAEMERVYFSGVQQYLLLFLENMQ